MIKVTVISSLPQNACAIRLYWNFPSRVHERGKSSPTVAQDDEICGFVRKKICVVVRKETWDSSTVTKELENRSVESFVRRKNKSTDWTHGMLLNLTIDLCLRSPHHLGSAQSRESGWKNTETTCQRRFWTTLFTALFENYSSDAREITLMLPSQKSTTPSK